MNSKNKNNHQEHRDLPWESHANAEKSKRKKEYKLAFFLLILFLFLTFVEFRLFDISDSLPFVHSIFFFGLVNFNIILFLTLIFMIFRNVVKIFAEKEKSIFGSTLKGKLIAAFMAFSTVPTILMFLISLVYLNHSFNRWFGEKMSGILKSSLEITNEYYVGEKNKNYHFANVLSKEIKKDDKIDNIRLKLAKYRNRFALDQVHYVDSRGVNLYVSSDNLSMPKNVKAKKEFIVKGTVKRLEASSIVSSDQGNYVRVIVPILEKPNAALMVSSFIGVPLLTKIDKIAGVYAEIRNINPLEYPVKSIYLNILVLITLTILLFASWFGFYLARQLAVPLQVLGFATKEISKGYYEPISYQAGSREVNHLIDNFNTMSSELQKSEKEIQQANNTLKNTLDRLDQHSKYIEVVLSNVTTGVVSVDDHGFITMVNDYAQKLLGVNQKEFSGVKSREYFPKEYYEVFKGVLESMAELRVDHLTKEVKIQVQRRSVPFQISVSVLYDEMKKEIGKVFVFDDLTTILKAQKAAAWTEVASRLAHEIKNPLTPIKLAAQRLKKKFSSQITDESYIESLNMIIEQTDGLRDLVNEFGHFARLPKANPVSTSLNQLIQQVIAVYETSEIVVGPLSKVKNLEKKIQIQFTADDSLPAFLFDPDQIKRAMVNLIDNSIMAVAGNRDGQVAISTQFNSDLRLAQIHIKDNGPGFPDGLEGKVFEAYMTTKQTGTGLGLAIVKRTIEDHSGVVRALNNSGGGAHIFIELPLVLKETNTNTSKNSFVVKEPYGEADYT
ncbi:MAG: PAS domain S-box protein [Bdellovibrionaceae bacterium]|jgi:two-component system, NtrC family, nitrogen regulation sensor histidine kinase NtrY|nr:PAS domain S-box protein [Pseudobdellovibrionaceae bacterium]